MRGRGACMGIFGIFWEFLGGLLVRHVIPRGFAVPLCGVAQGGRCAAGVCGAFFYGNGGVRVALAWRLHGNFGDFLGIFGRVIGAPCDTPWVCGAAVWFGSGENVPGYACLFDGNGGMRVAWAWRLCLTCLTRWVRRCIPRGLAVPLSGLARAKIYRRGML